MFQKASATRAFEDVAEQIREAIVSGHLRPGQRLPAQRELAETFGVGRATLLEALRILEKSGLIVMRPGAKGGAFVTNPSIEQVSDSLDLLLRREGAGLEELAEFREQVEGGCAHYAALRAGEDELAEVERLLQELREYHDTPGLAWPTFIAREVELHLAVARLSHNRVSLAVLQAIHTTMDRAFSFLPPGYGRRILHDWQNILAAIRSHRAVEAEAMVRQHISFFSQIQIENAQRATKDDGRQKAHSPAIGALRVN